MNTLLSKPGWTFLLDTEDFRVYLLQIAINECKRLHEGLGKSQGLICIIAAKPVIQPQTTTKTDMINVPGIPIQVMRATIMVKRIIPIIIRTSIDFVSSSDR